MEISESILIAKTTTLRVAATAAAVAAVVASINNFCPGNLAGS